MERIAIPQQGDIAASRAKLHLRLYTGQRTFESKAAVAQLQSLLGSLDGSYEIEVLDGREYREQAARDQALFTPLLVRIAPGPVIRLPMPQASSDALKRALLS